MQGPGQKDAETDGADQGRIEQHCHGPLGMGQHPREQVVSCGNDHIAQYEDDPERVEPTARPGDQQDASEADKSRNPGSGANLLLEQRS
ncbi:hypothetical protein D3C87_1608960 [compost metagenome]